MNKIGIYFAYWTRDWSADYLYYLNKVAGLGFDVLEVGSGWLVEMPAEKRRELRKAAADRSVELTFCIGFPGKYDMASEDASVRRAGIEYAKRTLEVLHEMGGRIFGGINYTSWPSGLNEGLTDKSPYLERSAASLKQVMKTAEDYGIYYCVEIVNRFEQFLLNTAAEGMAFCEEVGSPNIKLLLDTYHMNIEEDSFAEAIRTAGSRLGHFHIGETNRKCPGTGKMPWDEITAALKETGYRGAIVMEPFEKMGGEVGRDIKVWRDLNPQADEAMMDADAEAALKFIRGKMR